MVPKAAKVQTMLPLVRATLASVQLNALTDGELLTRFVTTADETAFVELVRRLGPTVLGVCQRLLGPTPDAEDAFQVVFMVLARKAANVRPRQRVAAWIYGVAMLTARKARAAKALRQQRETTVAELPELPTAITTCEPDMAGVLDEELSRLPERLRLPLLLCELRELTVAQAAHELCWPVGTVASRLSRGRTLLAQRLRQRGVAFVGVGVSLSGALARVPSMLVQHTVSQALPATVRVTQSLSHEVLRVMWWQKVRLFTMSVAVPAALLVGSVGVVPVVTMTTAAPAAKPEKPVDPLERIKLDGVTRLLNVEAIRKDVDLSEEQTKKIEQAKMAAIEKQREELKKRLGIAMPGNPAVGALPPGVVVGGGVAIAGGGNVVVRNGGGVIDVVGIAEVDSELVALLKPEQVRRLKQISLQAQGPRVLLDRRVIRALGLSAEQEDKIDDAITKASKAEAITIPAGPQAAEQFAEKRAEQADKLWEETLNVLMKDQRATWDKLIGKTLPTKELQRADVNGPSTFINMRGGAMVPGVRIAPVPGVAVPALPVLPPVKP